VLEIHRQIIVYQWDINLVLQIGFVRLSR